MSSAVERHVRERIAAATVERDPFPHCVIDGVFPEDFFFELHEHWPEDAQLRPLGETTRVSRGDYLERLAVILDRDGLAAMPEALRRFWRDEVLGWLEKVPFMSALAGKFPAETGPRVARGANALQGDTLIVSDRERYKIGPHTDAPHRLVSALFYLPVDQWTFADRVGTVLYRPKDLGFTCAGGPHYPFKLFVAVKRVAFVPNRLLLFPKTSRSFHGVEPVNVPGIDRRLLVFNVRAPY